MRHGETLAPYFDRDEVRDFFDVLRRILADSSLSYAWPDRREVIVRTAQTPFAIEDVVHGIVEHPCGALANLLGARQGLSEVGCGVEALRGRPSPPALSLPGTHRIRLPRPALLTLTRYSPKVGAPDRVACFGAQGAPTRAGVHRGPAP
jgi:hypothetical protein